MSNLQTTLKKLNIPVPECDPTVFSHFRNEVILKSRIQRQNKIKSQTETQTETQTEQPDNDNSEIVIE